MNKEKLFAFLTVNGIKAALEKYYVTIDNYKDSKTDWETWRLYFEDEKSYFSFKLIKENGIYRYNFRYRDIPAHIYSLTTEEGDRLVLNLALIEDTLKSYADNKTNLVITKIFNGE